MSENEETGASVLTPGFLLVAARMLVGIRVPLSATAFIHRAGYVAQANDVSAKTSWPLALAKTCDDLWRVAEEMAIGSTERPLPGELFLLWSASRGAFAHAGIIAAVEDARWWSDGAKYYRCVTYEANTATNGSIGGGGVHRLVRDLSPDRGDRFIRWVDCDGYRCAEPAPPQAIRCLELMNARRAA